MYFIVKENELDWRKLFLKWHAWYKYIYITREGTDKLLHLIFSGRSLLIHALTSRAVEQNYCWTWWRHQMEIFSALLAFCAGNSPVTGEFPAQRPVARSFDVFFDLRLNKRLSKQWWGWWFETILCSLWRHCNELGFGWAATTTTTTTSQTNTITQKWPWLHFISSNLCVKAWFTIKYHLTSTRNHIVEKDNLMAIVSP